MVFQKLDRLELQPPTIAVPNAGEADPLPIPSDWVGWRQSCAVRNSGAAAKYAQEVDACFAGQ